MHIHPIFKKLARRCSPYFVICFGVLSAGTHAALPQMEAPSRGEGNGIIQTLQNHGFDIVGLIALAIAAAAFCGVAYHAYGSYSEVQSGKKTWGQFGLTCGVGALLLVIIIWLLTKGTGVL
ncbi:TIGR03745 family integrating conjugative element membrane protein [Pseudomonas sp. Y39-6]|uniref:TIGR03745 family integrating conjugative element membrane protein n=1 Tax=Pseudomonas sp. Y39-6 TaxID=2749807 RepID=UPI0019100B2C|nr:TIGR03745 family integrating conjugative element membrane protein [Pseudomonas sp. Y39-6]QPO21988.1 TIGR03745 family integrating conjugative element membrane protein [Pseudomonas sp. Y39-6]URS59309.1 TIGR03745 family integrating conjugative element membrane protein [Pseudomonas sp. Y39-6]